MNGSLRFPESALTNLALLQQELGRAWRTAHTPSSIRAIGVEAFPPISVGSTADTFEVVAFAPGINPKELNVTIDHGLLIISGERKSDAPADDERVSMYAQERFAGPFRRVINLSEDVDPENVNATYQDGCLRVSVGKLESSKPRVIDIN